MPRIEAASIDEHVRVQEERLIRAATQLFRDNGYTKTDMGSIARAIGLARSSLYRYYPNKDYVLLACIGHAMAPVLKELEALKASVPEPRARIAAWLDLQLDLATSDIHFGLEMIGEIQNADTA
ncbi:MAG: TetR/AcrR family transcriptional regulator [Gammaproteobacteria bacterium]